MEFRSIVGKMLYIGGERPDCQFAINALAAWMSKPTKTAWRHAEHLASYLVGTEFYRLLIKSSRCGKSMLDMREMQEIEAKKVHLMEVVTDSDNAGDQNSRKSITSFQVFLDGILMESRVRSQKSISLSSGESEYVAKDFFFGMSGPSSEATHQLWCAGQTAAQPAECAAKLGLAEPDTWMQS